MASITILHNPACATSSNVPASIRNSGAGPIIETPLGTRLCRPSETVLALLPALRRCALSKEAVEPGIDTEGRRVVR